MDDKKQPEFNTKAHKVSLARRSLCVRKKASELAVLCDASLCLIQFDQDGQLKTFPEDASEVNNVLKRYLCVGRKVPEKRKVSGLTLHGDEAKQLVPIHDGLHENDEESPPSLGDELLDTKPALELLNFRHVLDVKMKKLEERIKLLKGTKSPEKKQKASTLVQRYQDGTSFNPDDLQLSCNFLGSQPVSMHNGVDLAAPPPDHPLPYHHLGLAANSGADGSFCFSEHRSTNCPSYDSCIQKMNNADGEHATLENMTIEDSMRQHHQAHDSGVAERIGLTLKDDESVAKKRKTISFDQQFYQDGTPCFSDDLQNRMNFSGIRSSSFNDSEGLSVDPTNHVVSQFQSIEAATNVAQSRFPLNELPYSAVPSCDNGCKVDAAKEEHNKP